MWSAALLLCACAEPSTVPPAKAPPSLAPAARPALRPEGLTLQAQLRYAAEKKAGLWRTDPAPSDAPFTDTMLARNFKRVAFYSEFTREDGQYLARRGAVPLQRWAKAPLFSLTHGPSLPRAERQADEATLAALTQKIAPLTKLALQKGEPATFEVMVLSETERPAAIAALGARQPQIGAAALAHLSALDPQTKCTVVTLAQNHDIIFAAAVIRAELPREVRSACLFEEIAQGLGLSNDHPLVRPSLFNDDNEFAILTAQDALLLQMLYDPRLRPGMSEAEADPILRRIATELHPSAQARPSL